VYNELPESDLVCISDLSENSLKSLKSIYHCETATDYGRILDDKSIQAVSVCTPASTHYKIVKDALEKGKDVLVEKPITLKAVEGEKLVKIAEEAGKVLMVGHIFRFNPAVLRLKEELEKNSLGKLNFLLNMRMGPRAPREDCGVIYDFAPHDIDISNFFLNETLPERVFATAGYYHQSHFDDAGFVTLEYPNGILSHIVVSWLTPKKIREVVVVGGNKSVKLDYMTQELEFYDQGVVAKYDSFGKFSLSMREGDVYKPYIRAEEPLKKEIQHFLDCVASRKKPIISGEIGINTVKVLEKAMESIEKKRMVEL
jgi:predicted dehydrogenase